MHTTTTFARTALIAGAFLFGAAAIVPQPAFAQSRSGAVAPPLRSAWRPPFPPPRPAPHRRS